MKNNQSQKNIQLDWQQVKLGDISKIYDGTHQTPNYVESGIPFYSVEHVTANDFSNTKFISEEIYNSEIKRVKIESGDILMTRIGDVGTTKFIDWNPKASFYVSLSLIKCKKEINSKFIDKVIKSNYFQGEIRARTLTVAFPNKINLGDISKCNLLLPSLPEQNRIVSVLEIWDKAIENLNKKIEIKKQIKKGLMQDLLTGKKRLSGFKDKWEQLKIKDIGEIVTGNTPSKRIAEYYGDKHLWATAFDFNGVYIKNTEIKLSEVGKNVARMVPAGSILITCIASIGKNAIAIKEMAFNQQINAIIPSKKHNSEFIYYLIENSAHKLKEVAGGGALAMISKGVFEKIKLTFPKLEEQNTIAKILTTADKEITELEKKLLIIKDQKKYLLNNLITGAIRTPENLKVN